jgi:signal peptidase
MVFAALILIAVPLFTGSSTYAVLTSSMAPRYPPGTLLVVKPSSFASLRTGDVITYQLESGKPAVVTHRVVSIGVTQKGERTLITKGDNNDLRDATPVREVQVRGKLLYAVPYAGFVANILGQHRGGATGVAAAALIVYGVFTGGKGLLTTKNRRPRRTNKFGTLG